MRSPQVQTPFVPRTLLRASATMLTAAVIGVLGWAGPATADHVMPPNIPSESEARTQLNALTVRAKGPQDGYDRSLFPHWSVVDSPCTARQVVLERDGHDVVTDDNCQPTAGSWWSAFDDEWVHDDPADISVDHFVPLSEALKTGAADWTTDERDDFANDVTSSQLWLATPSSNSVKVDKDHSEWMTSNRDVPFVYVMS